MSGSFPVDGAYVVAAALFAIYVALRFGIIPRLGGLRNSRTFLLVFLCGAVFVNLAHHGRRIHRGEWRDKVLYAEALRDVNQVLPEGTRVGYISSINKSDRNAWLVRYFSTQYAIAPWVLEEGTGPNWVFVNAVPYDPGLIPDGMVLVRDFGDGLMLFRRERK